MARSSRLLAFLYGLIGLIEISSEFTRESLPILHLISKPLLMPLLLMFFAASWQGSLREPRAYLLMLALVFSWLGDVFLMLNGANWFVPGLGSFLVAQLLYAYLFSRQSIGWLKQNPLWLLAFILYGAGLLYVIWPGLGELWIPVCVYAAAIMLMAAMALNRKEAVNKQSFQLVLIGAILFVISDSFIALNKFTYPFDLSRLLIMSTYISAQFLIVFGFMKSRD